MKPSSPSTLRGKYLAAPWLSRLGLGSFIVILVGIFAAKDGYDAGSAAIGAIGVLLAAHIALRYPNELTTSLVVLGHFALMLMTSMIYGAMLMEQFAYGGVFIVIAINLFATILLMACAIRWSAGRLWLTLLLTFLCLDIFGSAVMAYTGIMNPLIPVALAAVVCFARCVLWRNLFSHFRKRNSLAYNRDKFSRFQSPEALASLTTVLEAAGANVSEAPEKSGPVNLIVETVDAVYYCLVIKAPAITIMEGPANRHDIGRIWTDGTAVDPLVFASLASAERLHKGLGKGREMRVLVVNANSKEGKERTLALTAKGFKRGGKQITLSSPAAMLRTVKKSEPAPKKNESKEATETVQESVVEVAA